MKQIKWGLIGCGIATNNNKEYDVENMVENVVNSLLTGELLNTCSAK